MRPGPKVIKIFLCSDETEIYPTHKCYLNVKFQPFLVISVFMSSLNFMLNSAEHEKSCITLGPGLSC